MEEKGYIERLKERLVTKICNCLDPKYQLLKNNFFDYDFLKTAIDCYQSPIIITDKDARIIMSNEAQRSQFREPVINSIMYLDYASRHKEFNGIDMYRMLTDCIKTGERLTLTGLLYNKISLEITIAPLKPVPKGAIITCENITLTLEDRIILKRIRAMDKMVDRIGLLKDDDTSIVDK